MPIIADHDEGLIAGGIVEDVPIGGGIIDDWTPVDLRTGEAYADFSHVPTARGLAATGARVVLPLGGALAGTVLAGPGVGTAIGGSLGAGAGEAIGEKIEGRDLSPKTIALEAALGAIPVPGGAPAKTMAGQIAKRAVAGAGFSAASEIPRAYVQGTEITPERLAEAALAGGAFGGVFGAAEHVAGRRAVAGELPIPEQQGGGIVEDVSPIVPPDSSLVLDQFGRPLRVGETASLFNGPREVMAPVDLESSVPQANALERMPPTTGGIIEDHAAAAMPPPEEPPPPVVSPPEPIVSPPPPIVPPKPPVVSASPENVSPAAPVDPALERSGILGYADTKSRGANPVYRVNTADVGVDPAAFQYKRGVDSSTGAGESIEGSPFNPDLIGTLKLWRDPESGKLWVVNGHHRYERIRRAGVPEFNAELIDVPTAHEAYMVGALQNIAEERGTALDAARLLRGGGFTREELYQYGVAKRSKIAREAVGLSQLNDALYRKVEIGELTTSRGAMIGSELPNPSDQDAIVRVLQAHDGEVDDDLLKETISLAKAAATRDVSAAGKQTSMFGDAPERRNLLIEQAKLLRHVKQKLGGAARSLTYVSDEGRQEILEAAGNQINVEESRRLARSEGNRLRAFEIDAVRPSTPIGAELVDAAERIASGQSEAAVKKHFYSFVQAELTNPGSASEGARGIGQVGGDATNEPTRAELEAAGQGTLLGGLPKQRTLGEMLNNERGATPVSGFGLRRLLRSKRIQGEERPVEDPRDPESQLPIYDEPSLGDLTRAQRGTAEPPPPAALLYDAAGRPIPQTGHLSSRDSESLTKSLLTNGGSDDLENFKNTLALQNRNAIEYARRGRVSITEQEIAARPLLVELSDRLNRNPDEFAASLRARGEAVNAESMRAMLHVSDQVNAAFWDVSGKLAKDRTNKALQAQLMRVLTVYRGVLAQEAGAAAEAGRTLNTLRHAASARGEGRAALENAIKQAGGEDRLSDIANLALRLDRNDPRQLSLFVAGVAKATTGDKIYEAWLSSLLSAPITHVVNALSNTAFLSQRLIERPTSALLDRARVGMFGGGRERFAGELGADIQGMTAPLRNARRAFVDSIPAEADTMGLVHGIRDGVRAGLKALITSPVSGSRLEETAPAIGGRLGRAIRTPLRMLQASDEFFKATAFYGDLYARAYRKARMEGATEAGDIAHRMTELLHVPTEEMWQGARSEALFRTFQTAPGPITSRVMDLRQAIPGKIGKILLPFVRTPVNLAKIGVEQSPLGMISLVNDAWRKRTLAGGDLTDKAARTAIGTLITGAVATMAAEGMVTGGGPKDPDRQRALRATGWQPYSVKIGDQWVSYARIDPLAITIGMAADGVEAWDLIETDDFVAKMGLLVGNNLTSKTYLSGLSDFMEAVTDPDRYGANWVQRMAGTVVPTGVAQLTRAIDPTPRKPNDVGEMLQSRIPGLSGNVSPIRDVWGEPVVLPGSAGERLFSPFRRSQISNDPASNELRRLDIAPGTPRKQLSAGLRGFSGEIDLNGPEYDRYVELSGQAAKRLVTSLVQAPNYRRMPDNQKEAAILKAFGTAREFARDSIRPNALKRSVEEKQLTADKLIPRAPAGVRMPRGLF